MLCFNRKMHFYKMTYVLIINNIKNFKIQLIKVKGIKHFEQKYLFLINDQCSVYQF